MPNPVGVARTSLHQPKKLLLFPNPNSEVTPFYLWGVEILADCRCLPQFDCMAMLINKGAFHIKIRLCMKINMVGNDQGVIIDKSR